MAKKVDPVKAKEKRQKIIAIGGAVILVGLLAYQVPKVMKHFNQKPPPGSVTGAQAEAAASRAPGTGTAPSLAAPTLGGGTEQSTAATPTAGDGVTSGDGAPQVQQGQLASFSIFQSKDPFAQQLRDSTQTGGGGSGSGGATSSGGGSTSSSGGGGSGTSGTAPAPGSAVISVNGTLMSVTVGGDFPADQPFFHLVSLTPHTAQISIVGGSYATGAPTVTLHENKPLTLMNTADGTRYKLVLKPQGTPIPGAATSTPTSTTPTSTTPPSTTTPSP